MSDEIWDENKNFAGLYGRVRDAEARAQSAERRTEAWKRRTWRNEGRAEAYREVALESVRAAQGAAAPARRGALKAVR